MSEVAARHMGEIESRPTPVQSVPRPAERRRSARVPISGPIRVGPPHRDPHARLSATDLSVGGMFIDADRPVRVGAKFCAEIVLSDGRHVYIPEAEVAYNRDRPHGAGFGVRFVELSDDARRLLEEEVARLGSEPWGDGGVDIAIDADRDPVSIPPVASEAPTAAELPKPTAPVGLRAPPSRRQTDLWSRLRHEARAMAAQLPSLWLVLAGVGAGLLVLAVGLVIWAELSQAPRVRSAEASLPPPGLTTETHQRLMGEEVPETLPALEPLAPPEALASPRPVEEPTRPRAEPAQPEPARTREAASPGPPAQRAGLPPGSASIGRVGLPEGARIKRTSRLRSPERFVVDVRGLTQMPEHVDFDRSRIRRVRFGRHDGFGRLVFDLTGSAGRLTPRLDGDDLRIIEID